MNNGNKLIQKRNGSFVDVPSLNLDTRKCRHGVMCALETLDDLRSHLSEILTAYPTEGKQNTELGGERGFMNVLSIALSEVSLKNQSEDFVLSEIESIVENNVSILRSCGIRRFTVMIARKNQFPLYFTFREQNDYREDQVIRHIEPAMAYQLELDRLENFEIKTCFVDNRRLHVYHGIGKSNSSDSRFFVRALVYPGQLTNAVKTHDFLVSEGDRILTDIMDALEIVSAVHQNTDCNIISVFFIPTFNLDITEIERSLHEFVNRHGSRLWTLRVTTAEVRFIIQSAPNSSPIPVRFIISNVSGYVTIIERYQEVRDATGMHKLMSLTSPPGSLHNHLVQFPYAIKEAIQPKRYKAHLMGTTYVYDFPEIFKEALYRIWKSYAHQFGAFVPSVLMNVKELVLGNDGNFVETIRSPGKTFSILI